MDNQLPRFQDLAQTGPGVSMDLHLQAIQPRSQVIPELPYTSDPDPAGRCGQGRSRGNDVPGTGRILNLCQRKMIGLGQETGCLLCSRWKFGRHPGGERVSSSFRLPDALAGRPIDSPVGSAQVGVQAGDPGKNLLQTHLGYFEEAAPPFLSGITIPTGSLGKKWSRLRTWVMQTAPWPLKR